MLRSTKASSSRHGALLLFALHIFCSVVSGSRVNSACHEHVPSFSSNISAAISVDTPAQRVSTISYTDGPHKSLFGKIAVTPAPNSAFRPYTHPRLVVDAQEWQGLLTRYAAFTENRTSWAFSHRLYSLRKGPLSSFISHLAALDTSAYTGDVEDLSIWNETQRAVLQPLADNLRISNELTSASLFLCPFWAGVSEELPAAEKFLPSNTISICRQAAVSWARVLLAHRVYNCAGACPSGDASTRASTWDYRRRWNVNNDWNTATFGLAIAYDVMFRIMTPDERKTVRSALAMLVMKRESWGATESSSRNSPNAALHPHRIFSNWATYHSNLYLANLVIEGETEFDVYTTSVLDKEGSDGFSPMFNHRFTKLIEAFMLHSVYPDGSTFEDGYTYFLALREGSLGLIAAHRRGLNVLNTPRFRGLIHNLAQMLEPWQCGSIVGHASGGGLSYPAYVGFFRYVYPDGPLPRMLWRQRMGDNFKNNAPCRILWHQNIIQLTLFGAEHHTDAAAKSLEGLSSTHKSHIPLSYFAPRRGLIIARSNYSESAAYMHFDARPDAFFVGHDNADRGVFTFAAYGQMWVQDFGEWRKNVDSRKHSLMHVDGLAQDEKAPSVSMKRMADDGEVMIASADLTYAYNVQWARNWPTANAPTRHVVTYTDNRTEVWKSARFIEKEIGHPRDFGWPAGDDGEDIGFNRESAAMWGDADLGFMGMYTWKRAYRTSALSWAVRSVALVRSDDKPGYMLVVDSFAAQDSDEHVFESYMMLHDHVEVIDFWSSCVENTCTIVLTAGTGPLLEIHVISRGTELSFRTERFQTERKHRRLIVRSGGLNREEMILGLHAHRNEAGGFHMTRDASDTLHVSYGEDVKYFKLDATEHDLLRTVKPQASPSTSPSASPSVSSSISPSVSASISPSVSASISPSVSATISPSVSATISPSVSASISPSVSATISPSVSATISPSVSATISPSVSASISPSVSASISPSVSASISPSVSATISPSVSASISPSVSASISPSVSASILPSASASPTPELTPTPSPSASVLASATPLATPSPSNSLVPPMASVWLRFWRKYYVRNGSGMKNNSRTFLQPTSQTHQMTLRIRTPRFVLRGNKKSRQVYEVTTCHKGTTASTEIAVFYCGSKQLRSSNYQNRQCTAIVTAEDNEVCSGQRRRVHTVQMRPASFYYISLSASVVDDGELDVVIRARIRWRRR